MFIIKFFGILILIGVIFLLTIVLSLIFRFYGIFRQLTGKGPKPGAGQQGGQWYGQQQGPWGDRQQGPWAGQQQTQQGRNEQWYQGGDFSSSSSTSSSTTQSTVSGQPKPRTSIIDKNEGEYVDFEEIRD